MEKEEDKMGTHFCGGEMGVGKKPQRNRSLLLNGS
jgi:hypothetical protein